MFFHFDTWLRAMRAALAGKHWRPLRLPRQRKAIAASALHCFRPNLEPLELRLAPAIVTPFTVRYTVNTTGDTVILGNTLETASTVGNPGRTAQDVTNAQNGTGSFIDDNDWNMAYVDMDGNASTFDSSQASLNLPSGSSVLFAGLYWVGNSSSTQRNKVMLSTPASGGYTTLTGTIIGDSSGVSTVRGDTIAGVTSPSPAGPNYEGFANVTSLVQAGGNGAYTVANVQATTGTNYYAGWSMIIAYRAPGLPARNITVFDGYGVIQSTDPPLNIPISGFVAPPAGTVNSKVSVIAAEGDLGITGDSLKMNGTTLSNSLNPSDNFFNSSITNVGTPFTAKNPNYTNQLGFDADSVQVPAGTIANSATSATVTLTTSGDTYFPGAVATTIDLYAPNLVANKTVTDLSGGNNLPGDTLEYTVNVTNNGQDPAGNVILNDPIPANTTYVPGSLRIVSGANTGSKTDAAGDDQARFDSTNKQVIFDLGTGATATAGGTLAIGATTSISFDVKINNNVAANTVVVNQASLNYTGVTTGFAFASLSSAPGFTVTNSFADIAVTKSVSNSTPNVGDAITFTVTATNNGPGPATGVNVVDLLPSGLQLTNATTTQGVYTGGNGLWTIGSLANGASAVLTIFATVTGSTAQTNTATLSHTDSIDSISSNNQANATETPKHADLSVTKTVDIARPNVNDTVTFLITVAGAGPDPATNVQLTDLLPAGLMYVSSTPSAGTIYNSTNGLWTVGTITNGGSATLQLKAKVIVAGVLVNTAAVTHSDVFDPNTANNSASATVTPLQADLKLTKTVSNANPNVGDNITFLVTLTNLGPDFATGVTVQDSLPAGLTFVSATPSQGIYNPISGQWTVGVVDPLNPRTLALVATVVSSAAQTNRASVSHADQFDPDTTHNSDSVTETPQQADLVVTKTVSNATPNVGDTITFTVTVKNNGPNSATDVNVNDLLPTGLAYISNTVSQGNYFSTTGTWTVGILNNGSQATLTLTAKVASPIAQTNTATVTADQFDPNSGNNSQSATETPQQADLAITKTVDDSAPNVGDNITFTITVTNNGPNSATNVTVQELFGTGLVFVSSTPSQGTYDPTSGVWAVGTVGLAGAPTLLVVARAITDNVVTNSASVKHSDQFDPVSSNNSDSISVKGSQADLAVTKTVDRSTAAVGDTVTFTITVTNLDGSACHNVVVTDRLPAGLQYVSSSTTDGTYSNVLGIWALAGNLNNHQSETLTIQATMLTTTAQTNTAKVTFSDRPDPNLANNSGSATVNPATADLIVSKFVNDPNPNIGANITYTIQVTNSGPDTATNVTLQDTLPAGVTYLFSTPVGAYNPATAIWTVGTVSVGTPQILAIVCRVTALLPGPNTASIKHSDQFDPVTANNSDSASISPLSADLAIIKTVSDNTPNVGDTITFTVSLTNTGPANATNVTVTDLLPTGLTLVGNNPTQGTYAPATGLWTVGTLTNSATVILTLQALVVSSAAQTNRATISHSDQFDPNTANNSDTATETPQSSDLEVFKFVDNATPNVGDTVNFTIDIENIGPSAATNVLLNDLLPAGLAFVSSVPSQGSYNPSTGVWNVGMIPDAAVPSLILSAQVVSAGTLTNTASIGHSDQPDPNAANNQASATVTSLQADLQIAKTVSNARPNVGDTIAFTITLTDLGPGIATNVQVTDLLPAGLTLVSAIPSQGTYDTVTGVWSIPTVTTALARTLILEAHVDGPDPKTNTATITAADQFDPNPGNNSSSATETPLQADLGLTKTVSNAHPNVGDTIAYTVTLSNAGPDGATNVQVADLLPAGLGFAGATPSQGTYSGSTGLWNVGSVASNGVATLQIQAKVNSPSQQLNTATISEADQFDPDTANDSAAALETPQQADLSVRKSVSNPTPNVGDTITYTVRVTNSGPDAATGVVLSDVLPTGVSYQSSSASLGSYNPTTRAWTVGTVANGVTQTLTILAVVVNINPQANTANITKVDQFDPNIGNNFDTASINPQAADLQIAKTVSNPTPNVGDTITFTVTLTNDGPSAASNVQVTDLLPAGLTYVSSTPSPGTSYDPGAGLWTVGTVTTATPQTLAIQAKVVSPNAQTNTAAVSAVDQFDPDPANNQASATETPLQADLVIAKAVSNQRPNVGDTVTFTVAVADKGPNAASNVTVQDLLPAGLSLLSFTPSRGTYDPATGIWNIGAVEPSSAQTLLLNAQVISTLPATNTATITHSDQFDPDLTNNSASATETPQQADLVVSKTVSDTTPNVGDVLTYTVTVSNAGPDPATGVQLTDLLPAGLTLESATENQGAYDSSTGVWSVGQVGTSASATLTIRAQVASVAPTTNTASITHSDQFDPNTGNNTASATETPQQADLALTKSVDDANPNVGDVITFTVTLTDNSSNSASNVQVDDLLPAGLIFLNDVPSQGTYDGTTGVWVVGTVTTGSPQTLQIQATVAVPDAQTNTATIGHADQFDPNTGNNSASATETPQQADLALAKTVSNAKPNVGDTITFTVTITNQGPDVANNVQVTDLLPAGLTFVSAIPSASYNSTTGVWTVGTVTIGAPQTLQIQATVASPITRTNTATINHADQFDPNTANNSASATETPQRADLQISKTVNKPTPNVGDTIVYTITLTDNGPDPATNVTVQDTLPAGVTYVSSTPVGSYNPVSGVWTVGTVNPGTPQILTITATVNSSSPAANTVTISHADQFDPNTANNSDSASITPQQADLSVGKTVSNATPNVGDTVTFTVTLNNTGPANATNVSVTDLLPAGLTYVSSAPSQGTYVPATGLWTVGAVANGGRATLTLSARVASPTAQTNTASISHSDQFDPDSTDNSASATETPQQADLNLSKSVSNSTPNVNDTITFTVTLTNQGPNPATNVTIQDLLPAGLAFVSAMPTQGTYNSTSGAWVVGMVSPTAPQTLVIQARVVSSTAQTNVASISHSDQFDPDATDNSASVTETPQQADLALTKTVSNATPNVGDTITYTVTLSNAGSATATGVTVQDLLPAGLTFVSATPSQGTYDSGTGVWTAGTVTTATPQTLLIQATVAVPAAQTNTASISHSDQFDPKTSNNSASVTETPQQADLGLAKTVSNAKPNVGDTITFTVTLTNHGTATASNVQVTDVLPAGLTFVSATPSASYNSTTGVWTVGTVTTTTPQTLQIQATVVSSAAQTNTALITRADQFDPVTSNNTASATETPQRADLQVTKTVNNPTPNVGATIVYTITLTNNGPDPATNVTAQDTLPAGVAFVSAAPVGVYNSVSGLWTVGTVNPGTPQTLTITATVTSPNSAANTVNISHADQFDPNTANNSATASVTPQQADLTVGKTVSNATPNFGDTVTFTVTLNNTGPSNATNVSVTDLLPAGLTFVGSTPSQGTYVPATGLWTVGAVANGGRATLTLSARVASPSAQTNTATISHSDQFDPDTTDNSASATETPQQADLSLSKSVSNSTPNVGDTVTFTVGLTNQGPNTATNVTVQDLLPAGLAFVSAVPSQGTYNSTTGAWVVGMVLPTAPQSLVIQARVVSSTAQTNTAAVSHSDQFDPDATDNSASATETPQQADLALAKTVSNTTPNVGDTITFTVTLSNAGSATATGVIVQDLLPAGLTFVADTPSEGTYDSGTGVWTVGTVTTATPQTLQIQATVAVPAAQTNTATISHSDQFDPKMSNNSASATETPQQADLALTKTVSNATPNVGNMITFTVTLTDKGTGTANNVQVSDLLPAGLTFVMATPSQGSYNSTSGLWTVGTVTTTTPQTLQIQATVASSAAQTNTAIITDADQFDPVTSNNMASATETPQQADLQVTKTVNNPAPNVGATVIYTITLVNNGPNPATNVTAQDTLPAGVTYVSSTPVGVYNPVSGVWTVGTVNPGTPQILTITATVTSPNPAANTVTISHADQFDPNLANNSATASVIPQQADLSVSKTVSNATPNVGDTVTFTVTLNNTGPSNATNVSVTDLLPAGLIFVSSTPSLGTTYNSTTGLWTVGAVANGGRATLALSARVNSPNAQTNTATISHADQVDPITSNNTASATETPQQADLNLSKSVSNSTPNVNDTITFTVTLTNQGPNPATNVTIQDLLPAGLAFVSAIPSQGTYNSTSGAWVVGMVSPTAPQTLVIQARVVSSTAQTNTASIGHSDQFDPDGTDNSASATETPQQADLALTKTVSNATPNVGDTITYTITLSNAGSATATGVTVQDLLPAGLTFVSATPSQGTYDSGTGVWAAGTVTTATPQTLQIQATVAVPAAQTNTASISHSDQFDPKTSNNSASATETPQQADLALVKTVSNATPNVGNTITFTVTLTDKGPGTANNVQVSDLLPAGLTFVMATPSQGNYNSTTGVWTVGTVTTTTPQTLQIQATVASSAAQTNTAIITHADQFDPVTSNNTASATETPQQADLQVTKTVNNPTPNVGATIIYTITLTNNGPNPATNVTAQDTLPAGVAFVSAAPVGVYNSVSGLWTVGTVNPGTPQKLTITATVTSPNPAANTVTISHADQFDPNTANNSATVSFSPQQADLALNKIVSNATPNVGDTITFTVTLTNTGPANAGSVSVTDLLPAGLTFVSSTPSQGTYVAATGLWTVGVVANGGHATLALSARVASPNAQTNTATISHAEQFDPNTGNNTASATETPQQADLSLSKSVNNPAPNVGDTVTFTVGLANQGPNPATNVTIQDLLPAGLAFVSAMPSQGTYNSTTGAWVVGMVSPTAPQSLIIQARVVSSTAQTNVASVSHSDQFDPDGTDNSASATETPQQADLALTKTVSNATPNVGDTITFTVTLSNAGSATATGVTVQDLLPAGLTFVSATPSQGTYDSGTGVWTVGTVTTATPQTLQIQATVAVPAAQTNTASISHSDQFDPKTSNNSASATETPQQADLALTKTVSNATPNVGNTITFTVTLTDKGPGTANNVQVSDLLPAGLTFVMATPSQGNYNSTSGVWTVGTVTTATPQTLQIQATVASSVAQTNTAIITDADQFDPVTSNNSASVTETPQQADLQVTKTVNNPTPNVGATVIYTITLVNNGPNPATNVTVQDTLPAGVAFVSATPVGVYNPVSGVWTVGTVNPGVPQILTITATVTSPNPAANTVTISHADQFDPNTANNSATASVTPQQADLTVGKTVSDATPNFGDTITFTVTLNNTGPSNATNVSVNDLLPVGLTFVSFTASQGTYAPATGVWTVGAVANGGLATLALSARVNSPNAQTNTATISHADQFDPNTANNTASATETPQQADLTLSKSVSDPTPNVGDTVSFTVTLANQGPNTATNVTVQDLLPAGLTFVSATPSQGTYNGTNGAWAVGTVSLTAPQTLTIQARVVGSGPQINSAEVSHSDQFDPDSTDNSASATVMPQQADIALRKTVSNATPNVGDVIRYQVVATNNGPNAATGLTVNDLLPAGLTIVSSSASNGAYDSTSGVWTIGTLASGDSAGLIINAQVVSSSARTNTAAVSHSDQFDPNTANNSSSVTETPQQADLNVTKTVSNPTPNVGDTVTFRVVLSNKGPNSATNVVLNDVLPPGLTFISAAPGQGTYDSISGVWQVGKVTAPTILDIQARVNSPSAQTNTATIAQADQFDPVTTNNTASATVRPQQADLALTKSVDDATPNVGDVISFTVTLTNIGNAATNVQVTDLLPAGLIFVNDVPSQGTYNSATGVWTVGTVATGAPKTLLLDARVLSTIPQTNTATISHSDQFDPNTGNNTASATETPQQADLALTKTVDNPTPNVGDIITFTVTLTNQGPDTATHVRVQDELPAGVSILFSTPSQGTYAASTGIWTVGTVTTAVSPTLQIRATVVSPRTQINTANILDGDQFDPDMSNNSASAIESPQQADLALAKSVNNATPNVGDTIAFTLTLTNNGPDPAANAQVTDLLPAGLTFVSATPSQGAYNSTTGVWTAGTVTTATPQTLQIQAKVVSPSAQTNSATITHADQADPDPTNNGASATETPQQADLRISKSVDNATPNVGDTVTFTVTVSNLGPNAATNVQVSDLLPAGLSFVSSNPSQGSYDSGTGLWSVGAVTATPETLQILATVLGPAAQTNTASVKHSDQFDPVSTNNSASATETPQQADLALAKTVNNAKPNVGNTITYTITLTDKGPSTATNVQVTDLLPAGLSFVSATPSQGTYVSATGIWSVGTVTTTTPQTLLIQASVTSPAAQTNTATISHADQFDPATANNSASVTETPQRSDLALSKTVMSVTPNVGDIVTFSVLLGNLGTDPATNVQVTDVLPTGLVFVSATPSQGTYVADTGLWTVGTVAVGPPPKTLLILARVLSPNPVTNTAVISHSDQFDPVTSNNSASATETPQQADLALSKAVSNATPNVGDTITFTVTLTNNGANTATNAQVTDLLPAGLTFVSATPSQGTYVAATGIWTVGTVTTATPQTLQIQAKVAASAAQTNIANISHSDQFDPITANNSASATETPQQSDLELAKTVSNPTPNVGDTITFTVTVTNNGADPATNVRVTDLLPAGLTFVSAVPSGSYNSTTGVWTVGTVTTAAPQTLVIQATVVSPSARTNTATISHSDQFDPDTGNNSAAATETPQQADLAVTKTVNNPTPNVGDTITYTITVTNNGPDSATNVTVQDLLPGGVSFVSATPGAIYDPIAGIWTVGTVNVGAPQTLAINAQVITSTPPPVNTARINHADQFDPNTANNSDTASVNPQEADLSIGKTVSNDTPNVGDVITFTVTLTNNGFANATNVSVNDLLPAGLTFVSATPSQGAYVAASGIWTVGSLANGAQATLPIQARVVSSSAKTNTATISHADQFDPNTANNSDSVTETPQSADLALTKSIDNARPNVGDIVTYTIDLHNAGPDAATNVVVNDLLPAGLSLQTSTPSQGTYTGGVWTVGTVTPGVAQTLIITAQVVSPNAQTNTATIGHSDQFDPVTTNNSASATETPQRADLAITKTVSPTAPNVGDTVTYTVTLTNKGPDTATDITVTDLLPAGLTFVSATPSLGAYDSVSGLWTIASLANAGQATLVLNAVVNVPTPQTNTATISGADQFDPDKTNNSASAAATPQQADLALAKSVSNPKPNVGDVVTFTIQVSNQGPNTATNVFVSDLLPAGLTFVSATPSQGAYNSATGFWTVGTVTTAIMPALQIQARVSSPLAQTNTATILSADQFDPNMGNNTAIATETPQQADLAVAKTVNNPTPNVGDTIDYTITLANNGPDSATNVTLQDLLPAGLTFVTATPSVGSYNPTSGIWTVGTVTTTTPQTLLLFARVVSTLPATNTAAVKHADQFDPNLGNNQASVGETPQQADLFLSKTVDVSRPLVGDTVTFTVTLTDLGPNTATSVVVSDLLPAGLAFVSANPSQGSYDSSTGVWTVGAVTTAVPQTLQLLAKATVAIPLTNTASIKFADQFDPDLTNNTASITITPLVPKADLVLSKTADQSQAAVGTNVTYTFIIRNLGPDTATGVTVTDPFPAGLVFVSAAVPSQGTYDPVTGIWSVGTLVNGTVATLSVTARVTVMGPIVNNAVAAADEIDPVLSNNNSSVTIIGLNPASIVSKRNFLAR